MKIRITMILVACLTSVSYTYSQAAVQGLEVYLLVVQLPAQRASKVLTLAVTGEPVEVAIPPIATVARESVLGVRGVLVPVAVEPGAERYMRDPHLYRVVLELDQRAQSQLQTAIDRHCSPGRDLQLAIGETIVGHVVIMGCGGAFEAGASFLNRGEAETFARRFSDQPVRFQEPTAASVVGKH